MLFSFSDAENISINGEFSEYACEQRANGKVSKPTPATVRACSKAVRRQRDEKQKQHDAKGVVGATQTPTIGTNTTEFAAS